MLSFRTFRIRFRYLILILTMASLGFSQLNLSSSLIFIGTVLFIYLILSGSVMDDFYTYIAMIPYFGIIMIGHYGVGFIFVFYSILKILYKTNAFKMEASIIPVLIVLIIAFLNDITQTTFAQLCLPILMIIYVNVFIKMVPLSKYNHYRAILIFMISVLICQTVMILQIRNGLFIVLNQDYDSIRLGQGDSDSHQGNNLGGAMGFPVYSVLVISISLILLINKRISSKYNLLFIVLILAEFIVTFFTLSRVYILGILTLSICLLGIILTKHFVKSFPYILIVIVFFLCIIKLGFFPIEPLIEKYEYRNSFKEDITTGRSEIFKDCVEYLSSNTKAFLFGEGERGYLNIGKQNNLSFSMSAHNLFLDALMAFGFIGTICLFYIFYLFTIKVRHFYKNSSSILSTTPLICFLIMSITGGSFIEFKSFIYLMFLILNVYAFNQENSSGLASGLSKRIAPRNSLD